MENRRVRQIERILRNMDDTTYESYGFYGCQSYHYKLDENGAIIKRDNFCGKPTVYATSEEVKFVRNMMKVGKENQL